MERIAGEALRPAPRPPPPREVNNNNNNYSKILQTNIKHRCKQSRKTTPGCKYNKNKNKITSNSNTKSKIVQNNENQRVRRKIDEQR
jgi:hypothetical protein